MTTTETDQNANCCPEGKNWVFLKDHSQHPPLKIVVPVFRVDNATLYEVEDVYCFQMGSNRSAQFVEVRQANQPIHRKGQILIPQIPVDVRILRTWKDAVSFLLTKPNTEAFTSHRPFRGEAQLEFMDAKQLAKFNQLQCFPFVRFLEQRHPELGQVDYASPRFQNRGFHQEPYMKELIVSTPSKEDWEFHERSSFVDVFRKTLNMLPDPLLGIVFEYAQSEFKQTIQDCLALGQHGVRIFVGEKSWLLRQTNLFFFCANCKEMENALLRFKRCGQCKRRKYCSRQCQKEHWRSHHKTECLWLTPGADAPVPPDGPNGPSF